VAGADGCIGVDGAETPGATAPPPLMGFAILDPVYLKNPRPWEVSLCDEEAESFS